MGDETRAKVQELVAGVVQLIDVFAGGKHVLGNQSFLVFGQWGHDVVQLNWGRSPID